MDLLDSFGVPLAKYEGFGTFTRKDGGGRELVSENVYFDVRQAVDGTVVARVVGPRGTLMAPLPGEGDFRLSGETTQGWYLETLGSTFLNSSRISSPGVEESVFLPERVKTWKPGPGSIRTAVFDIANYLFDRWDSPPKDPPRYDLTDWRVELRPVDGYKALANLLRNVGGILKTADLSVARLSSDGLVNFDDACEFLDSLSWPFSLLVGSKVNWLRVKGKDSFGEPVVVMHRSPIAKSFSTTHGALFPSWQADRRLFLQKWFIAKPSSPVDLNWVADFYLDVCARGIYLETRALIAAAMLDALVNALLPKRTWILGGEPSTPDKKRVRKGLKDVLQEAISVTTPEALGEFCENVQGLFRRPFRRRLKETLQSVNIRVESGFLSQVVSTRNELVHSGRFKSQVREEQYAEYRRLAWAGYCLALRLAGYPDLPPAPS